MNIKKFLLYVGLIISFSINPLFAKPRNLKPQYISVEEIGIKDKPSFWSSESDTFYYGDEVFVLDEKGSWVKVESVISGKKGWVKESVITSRKIIGRNKISVDAKEIALAGKGFSSPLEAEYSDFYNIDFDVVDNIEKIRISEKELKDFIIYGELRGEQE